ncbi:hypothetical protein LTS08_007124 [Lithohypha guttulata]|uniref:Uncharacterized protein n=1 Tax=Lithohypha guttulata TaxID=1690604 RepID=A0AAN7Y7A7_9EURO|nr:hypothetical protein LTR05_003878 [Lithohypha guttulata]KAK5097103.1 hypothetical protein LTS08_007124 [Lithohypha guttulata]
MAGLPGTWQNTNLKSMQEQWDQFLMTSDSQTASIHLENLKRIPFVGTYEHRLTIERLYKRIKDRGDKDIGYLNENSFWTMIKSEAAELGISNEKAMAGTLAQLQAMKDGIQEIKAVKKANSQIISIKKSYADASYEWWSALLKLVHHIGEIEKVNKIPTIVRLLNDAVLMRVIVSENDGCPDIKVEDIVEATSKIDLKEGAMVLCDDATYDHHGYSRSKGKIGIEKF